MRVATLRFAAPLLALAAWGALAVGCSEDAARRYEPLPPRDLSMLELMLELNPPYLGMQPVLRDRDKLDALASSAATIAALAEDPRMTAYTAAEDFGRDPAPFERFRVDLLEGARDARAAAEAGDLDALHDAYARVSASCTACHKRYSPHQ